MSESKQVNVPQRPRGVRFGRPRKIDVESQPGLIAQGLNAKQIAELFEYPLSAQDVPV